jgi:hypothetical protein
MRSDSFITIENKQQKDETIMILLLVTLQNEIMIASSQLKNKQQKDENWN